MTNDLKTLVGEINQYLDAIDPLWREAAKRLMHITDNNLWNKEYKTYEDFVRKEWGKSKRWAYQLISSERVVQQLEENCKATSAPLCTNVSERAARQMGSVPQELRAAVVEHINHAHKPVTSTAIKEAEIVVKKEKKVVEVDETGEVIPDRCLDIWHKRDEVQQWMTMASKLKCLMHDFQQNPTGAYIPLGGNTTTFETNLSSIHYSLEKCKAFAVCPLCKGSGKPHPSRDPKSHCELCEGRGLLSKTQWHRDWGCWISKTDKQVEMSRRESLQHEA